MTTMDDLAAGAVAELPPAQRATLARCALVSGFDEAMYEAALRIPEGPRLADLLRARTFELQPGVPGEYRVALSLREAAWRSWWPQGADQSGVPQDLRAFAAGVARYCQGAGRPVEALRALAVADEEAAAGWFDRLYRQRDADLDLAGCADLLDVLYELSSPDHSPPLSPALVPLRNDRTRYLNTRYLWHGARLASSRYLSRPRVETPLLDLLRAQPRTRALRLHGSSGMGKSWTLSWLIAEHCVPEPRRVPCALIDLGTIDPINATRHPWLVLLEIAGQLNVQMEGAPFQELLRQHGVARELLKPTQEDLARSGAAAVDSAAAPEEAEDVAFRFFCALREDTSHTPVVVAVDTFEDAVLKGTDPAALSRLLADLHDASPRVRLILSGRLTGEEERSPALRERLPGALMADMGLPEFSDAEAREYLTRVRGIDSVTLVEAAVKRAAGLPWRLALFADYLDHFPDADHETLEDVDPELAYCIDRIVGRISSHALQWLVRYAVVARRLLRRDFARRVLLPRVAAGMRGTDEDRPERDPLPPGSAAVFQHDDMPPPDAVWDDLLRYAASVSSWVQRAPGDPDTVILHPSVVAPLRLLLAQQPVHTLLHEDAARYYEELAWRDFTRWPAWTREALYHRFQAGGSGGIGTAWRAAVAEANAAHRSDWVAELAEEILDPEYAIGQGQLRAHALVERAWGAARHARGELLPGADGHWSVVEQSLDEARELCAADPCVDLPKTRWRVARAALHLARAEPERAVEVIQPVSDSAELSADRCSALMLRSEALRTLERHDASTAALLSARRLARQLGDVQTLARIALMLCEDAVSRRCYDEAHDWARTAANDGPTGELLGRIEIAQATLMLRMGCPATAALLADVPAKADRWVEYAVLRAEALLAAGRPAAAMRLCTQALAETGPRRDEAAALLALRARAAGELFMADEARDSLMLARGLYSRLKDHERAALCSVEAARVHLRAVGNLTRAKQYLDEAMGLTVDDGGEAWTRRLLLGAELDHRLGADAAETCLQALRTLETRPADPALVAAAAIAGLAAGGRHAEVFSQALLTVLRSVTPASARLALLGDLALCAEPLDVAGDLLDLVIPYAVPSSPESEADEAWLALHEAELRRLAGQPVQAAGIATRAAAQLARADPHAWWGWLQLMERIGPPARDEPVPPAGDPRATPLLEAAREIVLATRRMGIDPPEAAAGRLERAEALLEEVTLRATRWRALLHVAWSRLDAARGDGPRAELRARMAAAAYGELGDDTAAAGIAPEIVPPHHAAEPGWPQLDLHVARAPDEGLSISAEGRLLDLLPHDAPLCDALIQAHRIMSNTPLVRYLVDDVVVPLRLPRLDELLARGQPGPLDIRLTFASRLLARLPWELLRTPRGLLSADDRVRFLYRAPAQPQADRVQTRALQRALLRVGFDPGAADGLLGPDTEAAIRGFQRSAGRIVDGVAGPRTWKALRERLRSRRTSRGPHVLVLRRGTAGELAASRGRSLEGYRIEDLYRQAGFEVTAIRDPEALELPAPRAGTPVDVLHISTTMQSTGSVPTIDFGSATYGSESPWQHAQTELLAVTSADHLVKQLSGERTPLVVLDLTRPHGQSETMSQLLLRNDFARQLIGLGWIETVLATGLAEPGQSEEASRVLVQGLAEGLTAAQVARRLQRLDHQTALFSAVLPDTMLPLGC